VLTVLKDHIVDYMDHHYVGFLVSGRILRKITLEYRYDWRKQNDKSILQKEDNILHATGIKVKL